MTRSFVYLGALGAFCLALPNMALAATLEVGPEGAFSDIQPAIDAAVNGDVVSVAPGVYSAINFGGKAITVQSVAGVNDTIIDANGIGSPVVFNGGEDTTSLLLGFTITGGEGSGVNIFVGSGPVIRSCIVTGNSSDNGGGLNVWGAAQLRDIEVFGNSASNGGGVFLNNVNAILEQVAIFDNTAANGGGLYMTTGTVRRVEIANNVASGSGGGVFTQGGTVTNAVIDSNRATYGGGVHVGSSTTFRLTNSTVIQNIADTAFGSGGGISIASGASGTLRNNIVLENTAIVGGGVYSEGSNPGQFYNNVWNNSPNNFDGNAQNPNGANGNISADPLFSLAVPLALVSGSPSIDTGDPARSFEDPDGSVSDMGVYGGPTADWTPYADPDADGVNLADGDCDDNDQGNFPGNVETCDGSDNDCDMLVDEGLTTDDDGDGFSECDGDCDDADPGSFPGNPEVPGDGVDQDCDGVDAEESGCSSAPGQGSATWALGLLMLGALGLRRRDS